MQLVADVVADAVFPIPGMLVRSGLCDAQTQAVGFNASEVDPYLIVA